MEVLVKKYIDMIPSFDPVDDLITRHGPENVFVDGKCCAEMEPRERERAIKASRKQSDELKEPHTIERAMEQVEHDADHKMKGKK